MLRLVLLTALIAAPAWTLWEKDVPLAIDFTGGTELVLRVVSEVELAEQELAFGRPFTELERSRLEASLQDVVVGRVAERTRAGCGATAQPEGARDVRVILPPACLF